MDGYIARSKSDGKRDRFIVAGIHTIDKKQNKKREIFDWFRVCGLHCHCCLFHVVIDTII